MTEATVTALSCLLLLAALVAGLHALSKAGVPVETGEARCCRVLAAARKLGATPMTVLEDALARFTLFVRNVLNQVKVAKDLNDTQTARLAELQQRLDAALADDAADKATIVDLQGQINDLQSAVADQINATLDSLEHPPAVEEDTAPVDDAAVPAPEVPPAVDVPAEGAPDEAPVDEPPADEPVEAAPAGSVE